MKTVNLTLEQLLEIEIALDARIDVLDMRVKHWGMNEPNLQVWTSAARSARKLIREAIVISA